MKKSLFLSAVLFLVLDTTLIFAQQSNQPQPHINNATNTNTTSNSGYGQPQLQLSPESTMREMQKTDPQAAEAFWEAVKAGDMEKAKKIYADFKNKQAEQPPDTAFEKMIMTKEMKDALKRGDFQKAQEIARELQKMEAWEAEKPSLFERALSGDFPSDLMADNLKQYGYDIFLKTAPFVQQPMTGASSQSRMPASLQSMAPAFLQSMSPSQSMPPSQSMAAPSFQQTTAASVGPNYIIGPGDEFTLTLWGTAEGIFALRVTREGNVTLPKVGVVNVAGVRFGEIENTLRRHLSKYYANVNLSVAMGNLKTITVYMVGEVSNPGSYSLASLTTSFGALFAAGGPTKKGSLRSVQVLRAGKLVKTMDLYNYLMKGDRSQDIKLQNEDTIFVPLIGPIAGVSGMVYRPAIYEIRGNECIEDLINMAGGIMPLAQGGRIQINRFADNRKKLVLDIKLDQLRPDQQKPTLNIKLDQNADRQSNQSNLRDKVMNMDLIRVLPVYEEVWETVNLEGAVRNPGNYQWKDGLTVRDIINQGELLPTTDIRRAEVIRLTDDFMDRKIMPVDLNGLLNGDDIQNIALMPKDMVRVYTTYREMEKVTIKGEVVRPGEYDIYKGEHLSDFLKRVGGFTSEAYPYGMVFKRKGVKSAQDKIAQQFISRMQSQVLQAAAGSSATAVSSEEANFAKTELSLNQSIVDNLKAVQEQMEGRVALNITANIDEWAGSKDDLLLQEGDSINIPKKPQEILAMGELHSPGAQIYEPGLRVQDYIVQTGGYTKNADKENVFVIRANGFALSSESPKVGNIEKVELKAGDTIIVPIRVERYAGMRFSKDIIDILFKTAVVLATITVLF